MARIRTYDAPIDRIRPDDRGFTAQENAARRIQFATQDQVQALREGGRLAAQNIRAQYSADRAIDSLLNPPAPRSSGGGGSAGAGGSPRSSTAGPREAAQGAASLARALGGPPPIPEGPGALGHYVSFPQVPMGPYDPLYNTPGGMGGAGQRIPEGPSMAGQDNLPYPPQGDRRAINNPVAFPDQRPGAFDYETPNNGFFDVVGNTAQALWGYAQSYAGSIASGYRAGPTADAEAAAASENAGDYPQVTY